MSKNLQPIIEGLLFLSGDKGITVGELIIVTKTDQMSLERELEKLKKRYADDQSSAFEIIYTSNSYKLVTKKEFFEVFQTYSMLNIENTLTPTVLEVLAIIAYNQPMTRHEIEELKGTGASHILRPLMNKNLIYVSGQSKELGNPRLYSTTEDFLDYIGINSLDDLPPLSEFKLDQASSKDLFTNEKLDYLELSKMLLNEQNEFIVKDLNQEELAEINQIHDITIDVDLENRESQKEGK